MMAAAATADLQAREAIADGGRLRRQQQSQNRTGSHSLSGTTRAASSAAETPTAPSAPTRADCAVIGKVVHMVLSQSLNMTTDPTQSQTQRLAAVGSASVPLLGEKLGMSSRDLAAALLVTKCLRNGMSFRLMEECFADETIELYRTMERKLERHNISEQYLPLAGRLFDDYVSRQIEGQTVCLYIDGTTSRRFRAEERHVTVVLASCVNFPRPTVVCVHLATGPGGASAERWLLANIIWKLRIPMSKVAGIVSDNAANVRSAITWLSGADDDTKHGQQLFRKSMAARRVDSPMPPSATRTARVQQPSLTEVLDRRAIAQCMDELEQVDATLGEPRIDSKLSNQAVYDLLRAQARKSGVVSGKCLAHSFSLIVRAAYECVTQISVLIKHAKCGFSGRNRIGWRNDLKKQEQVDASALDCSTTRWGSVAVMGKLLATAGAKIARFVESRWRSCPAARTRDITDDVVHTSGRMTREACLELSRLLRDALTQRLLTAINQLAWPWADLITQLQADNLSSGTLRRAWRMLRTVDSGEPLYRATWRFRLAQVFESLGISRTTAHNQQPANSAHVPAVNVPQSVQEQLTKLEAEISTKITKHIASMLPHVAAMWVTHIDTYETPSSSTVAAAVEHLLRCYGNHEVAAFPATRAAMDSELQRWVGQTKEDRESSLSEWKTEDNAMSGRITSICWWHSATAQRQFPVLATAAGRVHTVIPTNAAAERAFSTLTAMEGQIARFANMSDDTYVTELRVRAAATASAELLHRSAAALLSRTADARARRAIRSATSTVRLSQRDASTMTDSDGGACVHSTTISQEKLMTGGAELQPNEASSERRESPQESLQLQDTIRATDCSTVQGPILPLIDGTVAQTTASTRRTLLHYFGSNAPNHVPVLAKPDRPSSPRLSGHVSGSHSPTHTTLDEQDSSSDKGAQSVTARTDSSVVASKRQPIHCLECEQTECLSALGSGVTRHGLELVNFSEASPLHGQFVQRQVDGNRLSGSACLSSSLGFEVGEWTLAWLEALSKHAYSISHTATHEAMSSGWPLLCVNASCDEQRSAQEILDAISCTANHLYRAIVDCRQPGFSTDAVSILLQLLGYPHLEYRKDGPTHPSQFLVQFDDLSAIHAVVIHADGHYRSFVHIESGRAMGGWFNSDSMQTTPEQFENTCQSAGDMIIKIRRELADEGLGIDRVWVLLRAQTLLRRVRELRQDALLQRWMGSVTKSAL